MPEFIVDLWNALLGLVTPAVAIAVVAALGAIGTARAAVADVALKRRLETARRFTELAEVANNTKGGTGLYEQIAAVALLASFGRDEPHLRAASRAVLDLVQGLGQATAATTGPSKVAAAAAAARRRVPDHDKRLTWYRRP